MSSTGITLGSDVMNVGSAGSMTAVRISTGRRPVNGTAEVTRDGETDANDANNNNNVDDGNNGNATKRSDGEPGPAKIGDGPRVIIGTATVDVRRCVFADCRGRRRVIYCVAHARDEEETKV